jgi:hypothetical protein
MMGDEDDLGRRSKHSDYACKFVRVPDIILIAKGNQ